MSIHARTHTEDRRERERERERERSVCVCVAGGLTDTHTRKHTFAHTRVPCQCRPPPVHPASLIARLITGTCADVAIAGKGDVGCESRQNKVVAKTRVIGCISKCNLPVSSNVSISVRMR